MIICVVRAKFLVYFGVMPQTPPEFNWDAASAGLPTVAPPCPHYGTCGGCRLQQFAYGDQVLLKEKRLKTLFADKGLEPVRWLPSITGEPFGYRSRLRFSVKFVPKKGGALVGFHERKKQFIVDMRECLIIPKRVSNMITPLRELMGHWSNPRIVPQVSVSVSDDGDGYCFRHLEPLTEGDLSLLRDLERQHGIRVFLQSGGYDTIVPLNANDSANLSYRLEDFGLTIRYRSHHFTQVNAVVNRLMLKQALDLLEICSGEKGLDLFCGVGNFTLGLAHAGAEVLGMDSEGDQIAIAEQNAIENKLSHLIRFEARDLYTAEGTATLPWEGRSFVLLDPPRTGALEVCRSLPTEQSIRLLYVSCNPETLVQDAEFLAKEKGMRLEALGLLDMFPQTLQAEAMAYFTV
jgi:23S rRNA (uracil1939-C5)-methyltransferase